jgi:hypothetical protein
MSAAETSGMKVVFFIDDPSGVRSKESTSGPEKLERHPLNGGEADVYIYWGLSRGMMPTPRVHRGSISDAMRLSPIRLIPFCAFSNTTRA